MRNQKEYTIGERLCFVSFSILISSLGEFISNKTETHQQYERGDIVNKLLNYTLWNIRRKKKYTVYKIYWIQRIFYFW